MQTTSSVVFPSASAVRYLWVSPYCLGRLDRASVPKRPSGYQKDQNISITEDFIDEHSEAFDCIKGGLLNQWAHFTTNNFVHNSKSATIWYCCDMITGHKIATILHMPKFQSCRAMCKIL